MKAEILGMFIPIVFLIGLFSVIAMNIFFKFKTKSLIADRVGSIDEWYKTEARAKIAKAEARAVRKHGMGLRICGLFIGLGFGMAIGCAIIAHPDFAANTDLEQEAIATFLVLALAMFCGGAGMIGAYFLERLLDGKSK